MTIDFPIYERSPSDESRGAQAKIGPDSGFTPAAFPYLPGFSPLW
jgi:hypothetical protein